MTLENIDYILYHGYYEDEKLFQHTQETLDLYKKGFYVFDYLVKQVNQDYYEGVFRGNDGNLYAKAIIDREEKYKKLKL